LKAPSQPTAVFIWLTALSIPNSELLNDHIRFPALAEPLPSPRTSALAHPLRRGHTGGKPKTLTGDGVLIGNAGTVLTTRLKASDLRLYIEFNVSPGAEGNVILPGGQKVKISDSSKQKVADASTSGYIGQFPTQNAAKSAGQWCNGFGNCISAQFKNNR
jgi:hypothetical protein